MGDSCQYLEECNVDGFFGWPKFLISIGQRGRESERIIINRPIPTRNTYPPHKALIIAPNSNQFSVQSLF